MPESDKHEDAPPQYHDWTVVPDTALLPPPPSIVYHSSPATNASRPSAERAHAWTSANPLWPPRSLSSMQLEAATHGNLGLVTPRELIGDVQPTKNKLNAWRVKTKARCEDACLFSNLPIYSALNKNLDTIYFEVAIKSIGTESGFAIGFIAPPYPTWRMPGWERGSLGIHSDDGRRFVNDTWGGRDFVAPFKEGENVGIGMRRKYKSSETMDPPSYRQSTAGDHQTHGSIQVFFTRNGREEGAWELDEETDAAMDQPGGITGLEGDRDLHAAIGLFGKCDIEARFGTWNG